MLACLPRSQSREQVERGGPVKASSLFAHVGNPTWLWGTLIFVKICCVFGHCAWKTELVSIFLLIPLGQRSPTPRPRNGTGPWPVRNWAAQQEVSDGRASETSSIFTAARHHSHYHLSSASCRHYGELYNYFIIYNNVIIIEVKCTVNVMCLNHPETISPRPHLWNNRLPRDQSLVPERLGIAALGEEKRRRAVSSLATHLVPLSIWSWAEAAGFGN